MPQIIVAADRGAAFGEGAVMFREGVNVADFQSEHFATQLVERLGWAVEDADQAERASAESRTIAEEPIAEEPIAEEPIADEPEPQPEERVSVPSPA